MIVRIRGILVQKTPTFVIVECAGVGYGINISAFTAGKLPTKAPKSFCTRISWSVKTP